MVVVNASFGLVVEEEDVVVVVSPPAFPLARLGVVVVVVLVDNPKLPFVGPFLDNG